MYFRILFLSQCKKNHFFVTAYYTEATHTLRYERRMQVLRHHCIIDNIPPAHPWTIAFQLLHKKDKALTKSRSLSRVSSLITPAMHISYCVLPTVNNSRNCHSILLSLASTAARMWTSLSQCTLSPVAKANGCAAASFALQPLSRFRLLSACATPPAAPGTVPVACVPV